MNTLKLNQLNKQKVAERELNLIQGGTTSNGTQDNNGGEELGYACWVQSRAWADYAEFYYGCGDGTANPQYSEALPF